MRHLTRVACVVYGSLSRANKVEGEARQTVCPGASTIFYETGEPVNVDGGGHSRSPLARRAASNLALAANS
jgi:hypothetical protein